mgnify:CR=1 FL=1
MVFNDFFISHFFTVNNKNSGKFACVRRVKHRQNGRQYAAKIMKRRRLRHGDVTDEILHEIRVLLSVADSERIVRLYEVYETRLDFTLVLEL